jgi:hypothetical protein
MGMCFMKLSNDITIGAEILGWDAVGRSAVEKRTYVGLEGYLG